ncbi:MAG: ADP-forming succinate--CoA ligase subunit beta [Chloroflexi bacterium]|nr:MAG: ADP-forming succinate--CoA ligase subunit beta [Chloroflexota bacterium]
MNLHEYQAKRLFAEHGIPIPNGDVAFSPTEASQIAEKLGGKVVVKAQVHTGGRGKAGGVKTAMSSAEAEAAAQQILGMDIKGLTVNKVLIDEFVPGGIKKELYMSILIDRGARRLMIMASAEGGMDIEEVAETNPDAIVKVHIDPLTGITESDIKQVFDGMGLDAGLYDQFNHVLNGLYDCFTAKDASLTEINPLVITGEDKIYALDGKMSIDDNGLSRQPAVKEMRDTSEEPESEKEARVAGINFIKLDGNIGCMVNGAGLAMTTMDVIKLEGGNPANFLDIGGGAKAESVATALRLILSDPSVEAVLINIFGGITRGDEVARGIVVALEQIDTDVPMVVRIAGTNAKKGLAILADADMETAVSLTDAARKSVAAAKKAKGA